MARNKDIEKIVKEIISDRLSVDKSKVNSDSLLREDLGVDSFGAVELIFELKDRFGIEIPQEDFSKIKRVRDIGEYISNHMPKG